MPALPPINVVSSVVGQRFGSPRKGRRRTRKGNPLKGMGGKTAGAHGEGTEEFSDLSLSEQNKVINALAGVFISEAESAGVSTERFTETTPSVLRSGQRPDPQRFREADPPAQTLAGAAMIPIVHVLQNEPGSKDAFRRFAARQLYDLGERGEGIRHGILQIEGAAELIKQGWSAEDIVDHLEAMKTPKGSIAPVSPHVKRFINAFFKAWGARASRKPKRRKLPKKEERATKRAQQVDISGFEGYQAAPRAADPGAKPGGALGSYLASMMRIREYNRVREVLPFFRAMSTMKLDDPVLEILDGMGDGYISKQDAQYLWSRISDEPWPDPELVKMITAAMESDDSVMRADTIARRIREVRAAIPDEQRAIDSITSTPEDRWASTVAEAWETQPDVIDVGSSEARDVLLTGRHPSDTLVLITDPNASRGVELWWVMRRGSGRASAGAIPISFKRGLDVGNAIPWTDLRDRLLNIKTADPGGGPGTKWVQIEGEWKPVQQASETGAKFAVVPHGHMVVRRTYGLADNPVPDDIDSSSVQRLQEINDQLDTPDLSREQVEALGAEAAVLKGILEDYIGSPVKRISGVDEPLIGSPTKLYGPRWGREKPRYGVFARQFPGEYPVEGMGPYQAAFAVPGQIRRTRVLSPELREAVRERLEEIDVLEYVMHERMSRPRSGRLRNKIEEIQKKADQEWNQMESMDHSSMFQLWTNLLDKHAPMGSHASLRELEKLLNEISQKWVRHKRRYHHYTDWAKALREHGFGPVFATAEARRQQLEREILDITDPMVAAAEELRKPLDPDLLDITGPEITPQRKSLNIRIPDAPRPVKDRPKFEQEFSGFLKGLMTDPEGTMDAKRVAELVSGQVSFDDIHNQIRKMPGGEPYAVEVAMYLSKFWDAPANRDVLSNYLGLSSEKAKTKTTDDLLRDAMGKGGRRFVDFAYEAYMQNAPKFSGFLKGLMTDPEGTMDAKRVAELVSGQVSFDDIHNQIRKMPGGEPYAVEVAMYLSKFWDAPANRDVLSNYLGLSSEKAKTKTTDDLLRDAMGKGGRRFVDFAYEAYMQNAPKTPPVQLEAYARGEFESAKQEGRLPTSKIETIEQFRDRMINNPEVLALVRHLADPSISDSRKNKSYRHLMQIVADMLGVDTSGIDDLIEKAKSPDADPELRRVMKPLLGE